MTTDPVCGMTVDPQQAAATFQYKDVSWYFCSEGCQHKFQTDPEQYLQAPA